MSPRIRREPFAADHERARTLASTRIDAQLLPENAGWLEDHLAWCRPCRAVAAEYDEQRLALRALRHDELRPPRDLWARTAAAIEVDPAHARRRPRGSTSGMRALVPVTGVLVVAVAVGAGLLNSATLFPSGSTTKGDEVVATPIALAAGDIQVLSHGQDGSLEIISGNVDEVCPVGADTCGLNPVLDVTQLAGLGSTGELDAIISPDRGQMVVVARGEGNKGVFVVPVKAHESASTTAPASSKPAPTTSPEAAVSAGTDVSAAPTATPEASTGAPATAEPASETPSDEPGSSPGATDATASESASPEESAAPSDEPTGGPDSSPPDATPEPAETPVPTDRPNPTPSVKVTPGPDGAIEIAHDVTVVGSIASYSPDGSRFAFSARPADGSAGPDVFVWRVGDRLARAVTTDHGSLFSGWLGGRPLVSRVVDGLPRTFVVDPATGTERLAHEDAMWRPTIGPGRLTAAWWDGTVRKSDDGMTWQPDKGRLVLGKWPNGGDDMQVLADGPVADWDIRWDDSGTMLAVWIAGGGPRHAGRLSLYAINPETGRIDLGSPKLDNEPAFAGFSLKPGQIAWSAPQDGGDTSVEVVAFAEGAIVGRLSLPAESGATVIR